MPAHASIARRIASEVAENKQWWAVEPRHSRPGLAPGDHGRILYALRVAKRAAQQLIEAETTARMMVARNVVQDGGPEAPVATKALERKMPVSAHSGRVNPFPSARDRI